MTPVPNRVTLISRPFTSTLCFDLLPPKSLLVIISQDYHLEISLETSLPTQLHSHSLSPLSLPLLLYLCPSLPQERATGKITENEHQNSQTERKK